MKKSTKRVRSIRALVPLLSMSLLLAGCGSGTGDGNGNGKSPDGATLTPLTVATTATVDSVPLHMAVDEGFFKDEGLDVTLVAAGSGNAIVPSLLAGEIDIARSNTATFVQAASEGIAIKIVGESGRLGPGENGVFVRQDSKIQTVADIAGHSVGVHSLGGITELLLTEAFDAEGLSPDKYQRIQLPFPEQGKALDQGQIDVAYVPEPFQSVMKSSGYRMILDATAGPTLAGLPVTVYATTAKFAADNADTLSAFLKALDRADKIASEDLDKVKEAVAKYAEIKPDVVASMNIGEKPWTSYPETKAIQKVIDLMNKYGLLKSPAKASEIVIEPKS